MLANKLNHYRNILSCVGNVIKAFEETKTDKWKKYHYTSCYLLGVLENVLEINAALFSMKSLLPYGSVTSSHKHVFQHDSYAALPSMWHIKQLSQGLMTSAV